MNKEEVRKRIEALRTSINHHRYQYHVLDKQEISDEALDSLKKELFDLEQQFPELITPDSPTQRIGGEPLKEFRKVRHETRMLSLNDAFSRQDVEDWLARLRNYLKTKNYDLPAEPEFYCDLKMDGLAVELVYENGQLKEGSTRGDGIIGEDVTQNLKTIEAIPLSLHATGYTPQAKLIVRGEVFLSKKEFARINAEQAKKGEKLYANPRNVAAGSIRQLDPNIAASRKLNFYAYFILNPDETYETHSERYAALKKFGFKVNPEGSVVNGVSGITKFHEAINKKREQLGFEIDGIVATINDGRAFELGDVIGKTPRGAIAFKFPAAEKTTQVEDIIIQLGRTGALTPVAVLTPVQVGGVTIKHATLHNADEIERLGLKIGDTVIVSRAGDVIPKITKVLLELRTGKERAFSMPTTCPIDGSRVVRDGVLSRCPNPECAGRSREALYHLVGRAGFNIEGMGPKIIDRFLDEGLITDAADIFTLTVDGIKNLERFGEKSAQNLVEEVAKKKHITLPRFLFSLGVLHVGEETAVLLTKHLTMSTQHLTSPKHILQAMQKLTIEDLQKIPDIGPKVSESIYNWFRHKQNTALLEKLNDVGIRIEPYTLSTAPRALSGQSFVLTGTLSTMTRDEAKEKIRALGGDITESVSRKTSYVVAGEEAGSKLDKAHKLGIQVLDEQEFLKLLTR